MKGLTLKEIRERKGYKQIEAAEMIGVSVDTLGNYERGLNNALFLEGHSAANAVIHLRFCGKQ